MLQGTLPAGFIAACLPTKTGKLPSGAQWLHEIKHDSASLPARATGGRAEPFRHDVTSLDVQKITLTALVDQPHNSN
jgi:hypothetical protein